MGWVAIDSAFYKELLRTSRKFTRMEAAFCLTHDFNFNKSWSIKSYAKMWGWSRNKVRKFIKEIQTTQGSVMNGAKNQKGHPIRLIGNGSAGHKDTPTNLKGHPINNNNAGFQPHRDTQGLKRTPETVDTRHYADC